MTFTALTCLICADKNAKDVKEVLGCVSWGFEMWQATQGAVDQKIVQLTRPTLQCGDSTGVRDAWLNAAAQWNLSERNLQLGTELYK